MDNDLPATMPVMIDSLDPLATGAKRLRDKVCIVTI